MISGYLWLAFPHHHPDRCMKRILLCLLTLCLLAGSALVSEEPLLFRWEPTGWDNFGDALSQPLVERILARSVKRASSVNQKKVLAIGSIMHLANDGDPALLFGVLFPEFVPDPKRDYVVIPHASETGLFRTDPNFVSPKEPWQAVVQKIVESKFVISSSLHGIIIAEAYGIPARMLLVTNKAQFFKYQDYYHGTGRPDFKYAASIKEALEMGGEPPPKCDLEKLLNSFPYDLWN